MRSVSRAHVIACARTSKSVGSRLPSIRRKLPALSALFDYLCERNAVAGNPVVGVKAAAANGNEGSIAGLGDAQARELLEARRRTPLRVCATALSWRPCSITVCAARSLAACGFATFRTVRREAFPREG